MKQSLPLDILVCPATHQKLRPASEEELQKATEAFSAENLLYANGQKVTEAFNGLLVREDEKQAYLVKDGIPVLLTQEALSHW